ncbi:MAG TPA: hypothetical protein VKF59_23165 [Candidatus Dormibacteraeota bacterium]|nr:hypothetical protein [Candidatus Dormibacteraeota bacterium]
MATLYDIISELRREHPTPSGSRTLDLVVAELGETRDNLRHALSRLEDRPIPSGGRAVLDQLAERAAAEGLDDYEVPLSPDELRASLEPMDPSQVGIGILLGGTAVVVTALAVAAFIAGLNGIFHFV